MVRRDHLVVVLLCTIAAVGVLTVGPVVGASQSSATDGYPICSVCYEAGDQYLENTTFAASDAEIELTRNGSARWTVRNRLEPESAVPTHDEASRAVRRAIQDGFLGSVENVSFAVEDRTFVVEFTVSEFADSEPFGTRTISYFENRAGPYEPATINGDVTIQAPPGYRPVGSVPYADRDGDVVALSGREIQFQSRSIVFAPEASATIAGPLLADLAWYAERGESITAYSLGTYGGAFAAITAFTFGLAWWRPETEERVIDEQDGGWLAGPAFAFAGVALFLLFDALLGELAWGAWPLTALLTLYALASLGTRIDYHRPTRSVALQIMGVVALFLSSLQFGLPALCAGLVVVGGLAVVGAGAAREDGKWVATLAYLAVFVVLATIAALLNTGGTTSWLGAAYFILLAAVYPLFFLPALSLGAKFDAPWRRMNRGASSRGTPRE